ncbi:type II secretion system minor pseudopilin GspK [Parvibium lacunae]|uniref:Type II secretion system protein K n=1 Tax=Parvibium lacunae TaxID=1888893 RepID=A0A368KZU1_9BURK|nr:type II secretion system minor pseudopilin GspK [Parvibium lacunae]RCS56813.1 general secretion pathway protein GspK [Parvibium lacunae]
MSACPSHPGAVRGAALISAMLIVALAVILIDYLLSQQATLIRLVEMQRTQTQTRLVLDAGINWGRRILQEDARNSSADHWGETWAVALAPTPVNDMLARGQNAAERTDVAADSDTAWLSGKITDSQARYNLRNLYMVNTGNSTTPSGVALNPTELAALTRLWRVLGLNASLTDSLARALRGQANAESGGGETAQPLILTDIDDLRQISGFDAATMRKIEPYLVVLPGPSPLNLNTAPPALIAARIPELEMAGAERLVQERQRAALRDLADLISRFPDRPLQLNPSEVSVSSQYFEIIGQVQWRELTLARQALVWRDAGNTRLLWERAR